MGQESLIYSFVARGSVVLAEYTSFSGNFSVIAVQCLENLPAHNGKFTFSCDGHTFNFLVEDGFTYLVVADENFGRQVPFAFLERIKEDFNQHHGERHEDVYNIAYSLDKDFGPKLRDHMQYCVDHLQEMNRILNIKAQVSEVKGIMIENIEKVLDRGEKIELLVDKTENLRFKADSFQRQGRQLRRKMWLQNFKVKLILLSIVITFIFIIWISVCHGFKC